MSAIGNLGKDAIINNVNGQSVINFNIAHTHSYTNAQGVKVNETTWISCAYWTQKLRIADYLLKGQQVYVDGIPSIKTYESNGRQSTCFALKVSNITLCGSPKNNESAASNQPAAATQQSTGDITGDVEDLPF